MSDEPGPFKERIAASGTIDLGINLYENEFRIYDPAKPERCRRFSGAVVSGTHSKPYVIDPRELVSVMGVRFKPGGAFPFLGTPASELADAHVDLEALWGASARELDERLCAAKTTAERFSLLEKALMAHLFQPLECHYAVRFGTSSGFVPDLILVAGAVEDSGKDCSRLRSILPLEHLIRRSGLVCLCALPVP